MRPRLEEAPHQRGRGHVRECIWMLVVPPSSHGKGIESHFDAPRPKDYELRLFAGLLVALVRLFEEEREAEEQLGHGGGHVGAEPLDDGLV